MRGSKPEYPEKTPTREERDARRKEDVKHDIFVRECERDIILYNYTIHVHIL